MVLVKRIKEQQEKLHKDLWKIVDDLRGSMQANEFRDYIFGLIMFKYLSEQLVKNINEALEKDGICFEEALNNDELKEAIPNFAIETLGYYISPKHLFSSIVKNIENNEFSVSDLYNAINEFNESIYKNDDNGINKSLHAFEHLFDGMDLTSTKLGKSDKERTHVMSELISRIESIDFEFGTDSEIDVLGEAYEFLLNMFSKEAGKSGEFFTPSSVSTILSKIVIGDRKEIKSAYDGTCGSGSLLLKVLNNGKGAKVHKIYGQERASLTHNLCRMNLLLNGLTYEDFDVRNGDTLENPMHLDERFDVIVANPPYSVKYNASNDKLEDPRFKDYGKLAPKSKGDFAFVQHMLYQLKDDGTMAVVLPHGVLFRGDAEAHIRKYIIEKNWLDAVIGLPSNIFNGTSIPTCILVFKKCRKNDDNILFIDASNEFIKEKKINIIGEEHINKIVKAYEDRVNIDKFSHVASMDEIKENDYNLNIPRYVDTFEEEEPIDLVAVSERIKDIDKEIAKLDEELAIYLRELGL